MVEKWQKERIDRVKAITTPGERKIGSSEAAKSEYFLGISQTIISTLAGGNNLPGRNISPLRYIKWTWKSSSFPLKQLYGELGFKELEEDLKAKLSDPEIKKKYEEDAFKFLTDGICGTYERISNPNYKPETNEKIIKESLDKVKGKVLLNQQIPKGQTPGKATIEHVRNILTKYFKLCPAKADSGPVSNSPSRPFGKDMDPENPPPLALTILREIEGLKKRKVYANEESIAKMAATHGLRVVEVKRVERLLERVGGKVVARKKS